MWNGVLQLFIQLFINTIIHLYNYLYIGSADDFLKMSQMSSAFKSLRLRFFRLGQWWLNIGFEYNINFETVSLWPNFHNEPCDSQDMSGKRTQTCIKHCINSLQIMLNEESLNSEIK